MYLVKYGTVKHVGFSYNFFKSKLFKWSEINILLFIIIICNFSMDFGSNG